MLLAPFMCSFMDAHQLERAVVEAWPAAETEDLDGWLLRASGGPTHRGNSVSTLDAGSALTLPTRIARAEAWYRERGKLPAFQVGPVSTPAELDRALDEGGYTIEGAAFAATAMPARVRHEARSALAAEVSRVASERWLELAGRTSRFASTYDVFVGFLARLGDRCRYALALDGDRPVAACLGIVSEQRLGIYAMFTLPHERRRGAAKALLRALAQSAEDEAREELYLLVERDNASARPLYASVGFEDRFAYHYRVYDDGKRGRAFC